MKTFFTTVLFILLTLTIYSQNNCNCCSKNHEQFDFWIGSWVVKDNNGKILGYNTITKVENNCVLFEQWKSINGGTGRSHNYYDTKSNSWNQLWLDASGTILKLKGKLLNESMILKSDLTKDQNNILFYNQITWTPNKDGTVTQLWETYSKDNKLIKTLFKGIYTKIK